MRAFIAIELPADIKEAIVKIQDKLKTTLPKVSWTKTPNQHLTLKFLGEISPKQLKNLEEIISSAAKDTADFKIKLETLGFFPHAHAARVIWIGSNQLAQGLRATVQQLEEKIAALGKPKEKRPFSLHITIGRIKSPICPLILEKGINDLNAKIDYTTLEFNAKGITLFESILSAAGPTYKALKEENFRTN